MTDQKGFEMNHHTDTETDAESDTRTDASTDRHKGVRRGVGLGLGAGLLAGGAIGLLGVWPGSSSAADEADPAADPTAIVVPSQDGTDDTTGEETEPEDARPEPGTRLRELLQPLVDDGTIDASQADAVSSYLADQRLADGPPVRAHGGPIGHGLDVVADAIGIDEDTLRDELRAGGTIADIATANGVDPQSVIDALVADAQEHLDAAVANGRLDEAEAAERAATLEERITDRVNGETPLPELGERHHGGDHGA
jgi:hypothetical protein